MPLKKCTKNGKLGWKWGDSGKCYTGKNAKEKAKEQGRAIEATKSKASIFESFMKKINKILER